MSKKNLMNLGLESYGADAVSDAVELAATAQPVTLVVQEPQSVPQPISQADDLHRLQVIADALDETSDCLGSRVARIGISTIGGDSIVSLEAISLGQIAATVKRYVMMAIDFIKRFLVAVVNFGSRFIESQRYNRKEMANLLTATQSFMRTNRGGTYEVEGTAVVMLQLRGAIPAGPAELAKGFNEFRRDIDAPYMGWLVQASETIKAMDKLMSDIFAARSLLNASEDSFNALALLQTPEPPKGWKRDMQVAGASKAWSYVPQVVAWGGVRPNVVAGTDLLALEVSASMVTPFDAPDTSGTATLSGDLLMEYAKLGVGVVDLQINMAQPYDAVRHLSNAMLSNYTAKFVNVDDSKLTPADQQLIATRNSVINDAMGYLSFVMTSTANYMAYLAALRGSIQQVISSIVAPEPR